MKNETEEAGSGSETEYKEPIIHILPSATKVNEYEKVTVEVSIDNIENADLIEVYLDDKLMLNYSGKITFCDKAGIKTITVKVTDTNGKKYSKKEYIIISEVLGSGESEEETGNKGYTINLSHTTANVGEEVTLYARVNDESFYPIVKAYVDGDEKEFKDNIVKFTSDEAKIVKVRVVLIDLEGNRTEKEFECRFYDYSDKIPPNVEFTSSSAIEIDEIPTITAPTEILANMSDETSLKGYTFSYRLKGNDEWIAFKEGLANEDNGEIALFAQTSSSSNLLNFRTVSAVLDPTLLKNGLYELKFTAEDNGGNSSSTVMDIIVDGNMKVGDMAVGFTDMLDKTNGISLTANRYYDSKDKGSKGDFGYGWNFGTNNISLYVSSPLSEGFEVVRSGNLLNTLYTIYDTKPHYVVISYGNGKNDIFEVTLYEGSRKQSYLPPGQVTFIVNNISKSKNKLMLYNSNSGTYSEKINVNAFYNGNTPIFVGYDGEFLDFSKFALVTEEGTYLYLNEENGLNKMVDKYGIVTNVTKDGYISSAGSGINFARDEENRITSITDTNGNVMSYEYDENGNLSVVTNQAGISTYYEYDNTHNLVAMKASDGSVVARQIYDEAGRLIKTIDAEGNELIYSHDIGNRQEAVTNRRGYTTVYNYDENGNVLSAIDPYGNKKAYTYDENGNTLTETDENGNTTSYTYDDNANLLSVINAIGAKAEYSYDSSNRLISVKDADGIIIDLAYNDKNNLTKTITKSGLEMAYEYDDKQNVESISDNIGKIVSFTYDKNRNPITMTDALGNVTTFTYDENNNCTSKKGFVTDNKGNRKEISNTYVYDKMNRLIEIIDTEGNCSKTEYDDKGNIVAVVDNNGLRTEYTYDNNGNMLRVVYPDGTSESFSYDEENNLISSTSVTGKIIKYEYDRLDRLSKKIYPNGVAESYEYDALNRNTKITNALGDSCYYEYDKKSLLISNTDYNGNKYSFEYDNDGNCTKMIFPDDTFATTEYDIRGRIIKETDQMGGKTEYSYDNLDRLVKVTDNNGSSWSYTYDEQSNITSITDPKGKKTQYEYDSLGRNIKTILPLGMYSENVYDNNDKLVSYKDFNGDEIRYSYNEYGYLTTVKYSQGSKTEYIYNENGILTDVNFTDGEGVQKTHYDYNELDGLKKVTNADGTFVEYDYYDYGSLKSVTTSFGKTSYEYDILGRLTKVTDYNGGVTAYEYDKVGNLVKSVNPIGTIAEYVYDDLNRLKKETVTGSEGEILREYKYTLDKMGRRAKVEESGKDIANRTVEYGYDSLNRLESERITENGETSLVTYAFDELSNRISKNDNGNVTKYTYDANNRLITEGNKVYTYDKNGNTITITENGVSTTYTYFDFGKVKSITDQATKESYTYDYQGRRIRKESETAEKTEVFNYLLDDSGLVYNVLAEYDDVLKATSIYTYGNDIISIENQDETSYYIVDGQGNTRALTDVNGVITDTYTYDAFGNILERTGNTYNPYLYNQEQFDQATGLYYLRNRYMNPSTGRFISMDSYAGSIYDPMSLHKYLYANGNPTVYCDPTGYEGTYLEQIAKITIIETLNSIITTKIAQIGTTIATILYVLDEKNNSNNVKNIVYSNVYEADGNIEKDIEDEAEPDVPDESENEKDESLPQQGLIKGNIEGAPPIDAGKQGKHVKGHKNNTDPDKSTWPEGKTGVNETQEAWQEGKSVKPDGSVRIKNFNRPIGSNGETRVKVHIDKSGAIHGYPVP